MLYLFPPSLLLQKEHRLPVAVYVLPSVFPTSRPLRHVVSRSADSVLTEYWNSFTTFEGSQNSLFHE